MQYGDCTADLAALGPTLRNRLVDFEDVDPLADVDGLAALVSALDLVISVGNATVHLAGAVGTAAWNLLSAVPGWRWTIGRDTSLWYRSVRLFRQAEAGDWDEVFARVREELVRRLEQS